MIEQDRRYKNAPITEAVIDLRLQLPDDAKVEALLGLKAQLPVPYAPPKPFFEGIATFDLNPTGPAPVARTARSHRGYLFTRADERRVLTVKLDGFSYSSLAPYDRWRTFIQEARELWQHYRDAFHPKVITRVALRYINRINIPLGTTGLVRLEDYLKTYPQIADDLPQNTMSGFIMQVQVPQPDIESTLIVNQTIVDSPQPDRFSVVLDLDLFRLVQWEPTDDDMVWGFFEVLRQRKNQAFEASITDSTRELFK
jgi:uncharacterized protein (TIGR04255 family)